MKKTKKFIISGVVSVVIIAIMVVVIILSNYFESILTTYMGYIGGKSVDNWDYMDYDTSDELNAARRELSYDIMSEGAVLLKNDNSALPLSSGTAVSVFGQHAHELLASGSGSGSIGDPEQNLKEVLENSGFTVNETLWNFYLDNGGSSLGSGPALAGGNSQTDWSINEYPVENYTAAVKSSYANYSGAAIVVFSRTGGEGGDLATDMSAYGGSSSEHYLELCAEEKALLEEVTANFDKVIVLLNTNNTMELGFLDDYDIDACIYIGGVGMYGLSAIGDILNGTVNPSGRLGDTYVYDNFSSPASQNFGDYTYSNCDYNYVVYSEGIYVGYRYYETRYADVVMGADNAGSYDYDTTVTYPFGYGLSYTEFEYDNLSVSYSSSSDEFTITVDVTNAGSVDGKTTVQVYFQAPYVHGETTVEKSAIELGTFIKTDTIKAGETYTATLTLARSELASYDDETAKTYILDAGDYYITVGDNAHDALNNILKAQNYNVDGDDKLAWKYTQDSYDSATYSTDAYTGTTITNLFDDASYDGMVVISRENWAQVDEGIEQNNLALSESSLEQAGKTGMEASLNPDAGATVDKPTTNSGGTLSLKDFTETDWDDESWLTLVEQIKKSDLVKLFATAGYATVAVDYIDKPATTDSDGPAGIQSFVGGASEVQDAFGYPTETLLACTWNTDLAYRMGVMVGNDGLYAGVAGWYAPGMDTHRTPFGGRNFEYYSEDGVLGGEMGAATVQGAASKGLYCYIKHFALNEQDTNRGVSLHTWASEQAMREVYLKPFQISVQKGESLAVMTSLNAIGVTASAGNYNLITKLLKEEWGFKGMVITDYLSYDASLIEQVLYAGGDAMLSTYGSFSNPTDQTVAELQRAAKSILYTVSRSSAMYSGVSTGMPVYKLLVIIGEVVLALLLVGINLIIFLPRKKKKKQAE